MPTMPPENSHGRDLESISDETASQLTRRGLLLAAAAALGGSIVGCHLSPKDGANNRYNASLDDKFSKKTIKSDKRKSQPASKSKSKTPVSDEQRGVLRPVKSYDMRIPATIGGLAFDGSSLWMSAQSMGSDFFLRYSLEGTLQRTIVSSRGGNPAGGLAYDGKHLYNLNYGTNMGTGRGTIDRFTLEGKFLDAKPALGGRNTFGLVWNGKGFFQAHSPTVSLNSKIYKLDASRKEVGHVNVPFYVSGLAWDGENLWASSSTKRMLYELDPKSFKVVRQRKTSVALHDITWAKGNLYGTEANRNKLHKFDISP